MIPAKNFDYRVTCNRKDDRNDPIEIEFSLDFEDPSVYLDKIDQLIEGGDSKLRFKIVNIRRIVSLNKKNAKDKSFTRRFEYGITHKSPLFIKKNSENGFIVKKTNDGTLDLLTHEKFRELFDETIRGLLQENQPHASFWQRSPKYLVSSFDLNKFKDDVSSNIPLKNIFMLAGFRSDIEIKEEIEGIDNDSLRSRLISKVSNAVTRYVRDIWEHKIRIHVEIEKSGYCHVKVIDEGKHNEHDRYEMNDRSDGFKQFMSLILSLSVEAKEDVMRNNLILIDEPESHLHPSGISDLRDELIRIGKNNYLFVSTHSPFLVDTQHQQRNVIIRKNEYACTEKKEIESRDDIMSDTVFKRSLWYQPL